MITDPKQVVRTGYDRVSWAYRGDSVDLTDPAMAQYSDWVRELLPLLSLPVQVLELGCGNGLPTAKLLVGAGCTVTGVDISPVQIERARQLVPEANFICGDMTQIEFVGARFSAVVSFYAIIHIPVEEQARLIGRIREWLKPGGYLMMTVGTTAWTGTEDNWLNVEGGRMYWSHADATTYVRWLVESGYIVRWTQFIPEGQGGHTLVMAQRLD